MQMYLPQKRVTSAMERQQARQTPQAAGVPNSAFGGVENGTRTDLTTAMRARAAALQRQVPAAEQEADRLSAGITATTPDGVKREMGARLGADFTNVRMYLDEDAAYKADCMGAKAYTEGSNVYFGSGGFAPRVAAHELVHTIQQGAAEGSGVQQSISMGTVQMCPGNPKDATIHQWSSQQSLNKHFAKHGAEMGATNRDDYAKMANTLYANRSLYQCKVDAQGVSRVYDAKTNTFGVFNADGTTRTIFKPDRKQNYFDTQPGKAQIR